MTNDEARALIEAGRKHDEVMTEAPWESAETPPSSRRSWVRNVDRNHPDYDMRVAATGGDDDREREVVNRRDAIPNANGIAWMRTNLHALLDGYAAALNRVAMLQQHTAERDTARQDQQVTQDQLDKFMSACADQTIQIMELRGEVSRLRDGRSGAAPISDARLLEIETLCEAATPGPWRWGDWRTDFGLLESEFRLTLEHNPTHGAAPDPVQRDRRDDAVCRRVLAAEDEIANPADATFIAASRSVVPELIAEVKRLHRAVEDADGTAQREIERLHAENADLRLECNDAADIETELLIFRRFVRAIPGDALTRDKIHRDDFPELFTDSDGTALYMVEAKRRILEIRP
jgi:hypothetical protein